MTSPTPDFNIEEAAIELIGFVSGFFAGFIKGEPNWKVLEKKFQFYTEQAFKAGREKGLDEAADTCISLSNKWKFYLSASEYSTAIKALKEKEPV